jgi:hypothetical protein
MDLLDVETGQIEADVCRYVELLGTQARKASACEDMLKALAIR